MSTCTYHSLKEASSNTHDGFMIAACGNCKDCQELTPNPVYIRCDECSDKKNLCTECDETCDFVKEKALLAISKIREDIRDKYFLDVPEVIQKFEQLNEKVQKDEITSLDQIKSEYRAVEKVMNDLENKYWKSRYPVLLN